MLARDGYFTILQVTFVAIIVSLAASYLDHWSAYLIYIAMFILISLTLYFFRDPDRNVPDDEGLILAPADGKVVLVKEVKEKKYIKDKATQISIFLSPLDVHVNRLPASGLLEYLEYHPGAYLMAWDHRASEFNERADFGVLHPSGIKIFFRQITGFMARRIVYHIAKGDKLKAGVRFGMMKFGSRMDILVPAGIEIKTKKGDRTIAGETILGRIAAPDEKEVSGQREEKLRK